MPGMRQLGRLGRVLIRQRVEGDFQEFRLQCLRNGVDEADQRAGGAPSSSLTARQAGQVQ